MHGVAVKRFYGEAAKDVSLGLAKIFVLQPPPARLGRSPPFSSALPLQ